MEMVPIRNSKQIREIGYDPETEELRIRFAAGALYKWPNMSAHHYLNMLECDTPGSARLSVSQYFTQEIRSKPKEYPYEKLEPNDYSKAKPTPLEEAARLLHAELGGCQWYAGTIEIEGNSLVVHFQNEFPAELRNLTRSGWLGHPVLVAVRG